MVNYRVEGRQVRLGHLTDKWNFVDFMTKWTDKNKVEVSVRYLSGHRAREGTDEIAIGDVYTVFILSD